MILFCLLVRTFFYAIGKLEEGGTTPDPPHTHYRAGGSGMRERGCAWIGVRSQEKQWA